MVPGDAWREQKELKKLKNLQALWKLLVKPMKRCVLKMAFLVNSEVDGSTQVAPGRISAHLA